MRSFIFYATSNLIGPLDVSYIKEYTIKTGKGEDGLPKVAISANASIYNRAPISLPLILEFQIFYKNLHVLNIQISDVFLNPEGVTYPLPLFVETVEWTPLQEMIYKFSEGEDVQIILKNFRFNTDHRQLKWIQGLLYGLDFPLTLPAPDSPGIFRLFDALKKAGRQ